MITTQYKYFYQIMDGSDTVGVVAAESSDGKLVNELLVKAIKEHTSSDVVDIISIEYHKHSDSVVIVALADKEAEHVFEGEATWLYI